MRLTYIYHSGFSIETDGFSLLFDFFRDTNGKTSGGYVTQHLLNRPGPLYVLASHFHPDHFNPEVLSWKERKPDIHYLFSKDISPYRKNKVSFDNVIQAMKETGTELPSDLKETSLGGLAKIIHC